MSSGHKDDSSGGKAWDGVRHLSTPFGRIALNLPESSEIEIPQRKTRKARPPAKKDGLVAGSLPCAATINGACADALPGRKRKSAVKTRKLKNIPKYSDRARTDDRPGAAHPREMAGSLAGPLDEALTFERLWSCRAFVCQYSDPIQAGGVLSGAVGGENDCR